MNRKLKPVRPGEHLRELDVAEDERAARIEREAMPMESSPR
ncbi:MAG TPA: hypothetical protein VKS20_12275 [Candidatus Acidoferrales bacterium]|nr:hypothetical protein [Candidatus Acidoferrales bacterium]